MSANDDRLDAAIAIHRQGRVAEAESVYRAILAAEPDHAEARHMIGVVLLQRGDAAAAAAEIARAIDAKPDSARFHNNLGNAQLALGRAKDAAAAFTRAVELDPQFADAAFNLATVALGLGQIRRATAILTDMAKQFPDRAEVFVNLVAAHLKAGELDDAREWCRRGLRLHRDNATLQASYANILEMANRPEDAERPARKAVEIEPTAWNRTVLARVLRRLKCHDEARAAIEAALASNPAGEDRAAAEHELGLILDHLHDARGAFKAFAASNRITAESDEARRCDPDLLFQRVRRNTEWFTSDRVRALAERVAGGAAKAPVFFVGFPRSGTTLMEQILKAHPRLATTEERSPLPPTDRALAEMTGRETPEALEALDPRAMFDLRARFWKEAEAVVPDLGGKILIDKIPLNIVELGLINALFPSARVIVALRDPRDACLSCFMQRFRLNDAMANFLDIERTADAYAAVMGLWLHYRKTLTLPWMEYRYENLVGDFNGTVREVLDFIGVGWHADVAKYRAKAAGRYIKTPSYRDVTSGLYSRAIGRWRAYAEDLDPIADRLAPFVHAFGYGDG